MPEFIFAPDAVPPFPIFSKSWGSSGHPCFNGCSAQAVVSRGTIYLAGSIGCDKNYKLAGDIKAQTVSLYLVSATTQGSRNGF